jgi:hypothetical protein
LLANLNKALTIEYQPEGIDESITGS